MPLVIPGPAPLPEFLAALPLWDAARAAFATTVPQVVNIVSPGEEPGQKIRGVTSFRASPATPFSKDFVNGVMAGSYYNDYAYITGDSNTNLVVYCGPPELAVVGSIHHAFLPDPWTFTEGKSIDDYVLRFDGITRENLAAKKEEIRQYMRKQGTPSLLCALLLTNITAEHPQGLPMPTHAGPKFEENPYPSPADFEAEFPKPANPLYEESVANKTFRAKPGEEAAYEAEQAASTKWYEQYNAYMEERRKIWFAQQDERIAAGDLAKPNVPRGLRQVEYGTGGSLLLRRLLRHLYRSPQRGERHLCLFEPDFDELGWDKVFLAAFNAQGDLKPEPQNRECVLVPTGGEVERDPDGAANPSPRAGLTACGTGSRANQPPVRW